MNLLMLFLKSNKRKEMKNEKMKHTIKRLLTAVICIAGVLSLSGGAVTAQASSAFDPAAFQARDLGIYNVAQEGYLFGITCLWDGVHNNLNLNDGDLSTAFSTIADPDYTAETPLWIFADLLTEHSVSRVVLHPAEGMEDGFPVDFDILTSLDGENYQPAASVNGADWKNGAFTVEFPEVKARYVKLLTRKLGPGNATNGHYLALSELEVCARVDTASNMVLSNEALWLFKDPDTTKQLTLSRYRDGTPVEGKTLAWSSSDPSVVTVDETGLVAPVGFGAAEIFATDGTNMVRCPVEVKEDLEKDAFWVTTFWVSNHVDIQNLAKAVRLVAQSGVDHIEGTNNYDSSNNQTAMYTARLCWENGIAYSLRDGVFYSVNSYTDDQLVEALRSYEGTPGLYGFFLGDEPNADYKDYAAKIRVLNQANPHYIYHMNLLPPNSAFSGWQNYYTEFPALIGTSGRYEYLTFDQYPFGMGDGFDKMVFSSLNMVRKAGLQWNAATGFYMQSQVYEGHYDALTTPERYFNASMAMAYGYKNYKHFLALTPTVDESGTSYTSGILKPDFSPADYYEDIQAVNAYIHAMGTVMGDWDAIQVYHTQKITGTQQLPEDFVFADGGDNHIIYSLFRDRKSGNQAVMLTAADYNAGETITAEVTLQQDLQGLTCFDPLTGLTRPVTVAADGRFSLQLTPGCSQVVFLPEGADVSPVTEPTDNLAFGRGAFVSSSQADFWKNNKIGSRFLTDGDTNGCWRSVREDSHPTVTVDLGQVCTVGRVVLEANDKIPESRRCTDLRIFTSLDGKTYTEAGTVKQGVYTQDRLTCSFPGVDARYVRIMSDVEYTTGFSEVEIYAPEETAAPVEETVVPVEEPEKPEKSPILPIVLGALGVLVLGGLWLLLRKKK